MGWVRPPGPVAPGLRIGLLGGSFNPAHDGHVHASLAALKRLRLDYVWWLVSPQNPLKESAGMAPLVRRLAGARAKARHARIVATDIEAALGTRFTADTLARLKRRFPRLRFVWLMGADNLVQLPRWRCWQHIFALVPVAVVARPGTPLGGRTAKAARVFAPARRCPDARFAASAPPAWTILEVRHHPARATRLRASKLG